MKKLVLFCGDYDFIFFNLLILQYLFYSIFL